MAQYHWDNCPPITRSQVERLVQALRVVLNDNVVGMYLHGSMAYGCFNPLHSDIDIMVVTDEPLTNEIRRSLGVYLLQISNNPTPLNMTFIAKQTLDELKRPVNFEFRYNESRRKLMKSDIIDGKWHDWSASQTELYLISYFKMVSLFGITLYGEPVDRVFQEVPEEIYKASILDDYTTYVSSIENKPVGSILNMLRVYRYLQTGDVVSKDAAGAWGIEALPEATDLISTALTIYRGSLSQVEFDPQNLNDFIELMHNKLEAVR